MIRFLTGLSSFLAGVWLLADLPLVNPFPMLAAGWVLLGVGISIAAPALLDLLEVEK